MEYGRVIDHILAAWDLAAPRNKQGMLQLEVRDMWKDVPDHNANKVRDVQAYAAGRLHDGLKHGNW